ncbi:MAG: hypothetical protein KAU22_13050 [Desulfuromonadales bacterium]|nr:hypothetical protein [Desulfuromonadales bacterium]
MLIPIVYPDGKHDMIKGFLLSRLIDDKGIAKFKRSSGWISITSNKIRSSQRSTYTGPERRQLN